MAYRAPALFLALTALLLAAQPSAAPPLPPRPSPPITYTPIYRLPIVPRDFVGDWHADYNNMVRTLETELWAVRTTGGLESRVAAVESRATTLEAELPGKAPLVHGHTAAEVSGIAPVARAAVSAVAPLYYNVVSGQFSLTVSEVPHDQLAGYMPSRHRQQIDSLTSEDTLWSSAKTLSEIISHAGALLDDTRTTEVNVWSAAHVQAVLQAYSSGSHTHSSGQITDFTAAARAALIPVGPLTLDYSTGSLAVSIAAIDHDLLLHYDLNQHRALDDNATDPVKLWSSYKVNDEVARRAPLVHRHAPQDIDGLNINEGTIPSISSGALTQIWTQALNDVCAVRYTVTLVARLADGSSSTTGQWVFVVTKRSGSPAGLSIVQAKDAFGGYSYTPEGKMVSDLVVAPAIAGGNTLVLRATATTSGTADPGSFTLAYQVETLAL